MNTKIKTNQLKYFIDREKISEKYDIFYLETSEKYIKRGAYILDMAVLNRDIKAIKFESGKRLFILMYKDIQNKKKLKNMLSNIEGGEKFSIGLTMTDELEDRLLIQLLLNALGTYDSAFLKYSNLTGHFYCYHPSWIEHRKKNQQDVIRKIVCLEMNISRDMCFHMHVRTFFSEQFKKEIHFEKKKFEDYPKYILAANHTLRRRLKDEKDTCFIMRQKEGTKSNITFLDISDKEKYTASKMGMLNHVIQSFNEKYEGICKLDFTEKEVVRRIDNKSGKKAENIRRVKEILEEKKVHVVDKIGGDESIEFCKKIAEFLQKMYGIKATIGKRISKDKLNIAVIHYKEYYDGQKDPHNKKHDDAAVQHVTIENMKDSTLEAAIKTVMYEVVIKRDLVEKKISLFDWKQFGFSEPISFGIEEGTGDMKKYFFMNINPDGTFTIKEEELSFFAFNEYSELVEIFENGHMESTEVKGVIKFADGSINIIKDSDMYTVPEIAKIEAYLNAGDTNLRNQERREELLRSVLDIKMYNEGEKFYYFVGTVGAGMQSKIKSAAVIRSVEGHHGASVRFEKLLPLMNVLFVHNGQLTIVPFPFKYLREYVKKSIN